LSFLHDETTLPPGVEPVATQLGTPPPSPASLQTYPLTQPLDEQSPVWHWLSAPQLPSQQSDGLVQAPVPVPVGFAPLSLQR
jgi:hypothetical protein